MKITSHKIKLINLTDTASLESLYLILSNIPLIKTFKVNFSDQLIDISGKIKSDHLIQLLNDKGYHAVLQQNDEAEESYHQTYIRHLSHKFVISFLLGADLFALNYDHFCPSHHTILGKTIWLFIGFFSLLALIYLGFDIFKNSFFSFKNHTATSDTLIAISTIILWIYSNIAILISTVSVDVPVYFETIFFILSFYILNKIFESRTSKNSNSSEFYSKDKIISNIGIPTESSPYKFLLDKILPLFIPGILILSIFTALIWINLGFSINFIIFTAVTLLIFASPYLLGLAKPISLITSLQKAMEQGISIDDGESLLKISQLNMMIFNKNGTLTEGKPVLENIFVTHESDKRMALQLAASIEQYSNHPFALSFLKEAQRQQISLLPIFECEEIQSRGVRGYIDNQHIILGNAALMHYHQIPMNEYATKAAEIAFLGFTPIYLAIDQKIIALFVFSDAIKSEAQNLIMQLQKNGVEVLMLTSDHFQSSEIIAKQLGISKVIADKTSEEKVHVLMELQKRDKIVGILGDPKTDKTVFFQANAGFAIKYEDCITQQHDYIYINSLWDVVRLLKLSKKTHRNIKQNLMTACIYYLLGIPIGAGIFYPINGILLHPIFASLSMTFFSLLIIFNAKRLQSYQFQEIPI